MTSVVTPESLRAEVDLAVKAMDTQQALAEALGIKSPSISDWVRIPEHHCARVEELTGRRCELQRPDLLWLRGRDGKVTHCMKAIGTRAA